MHVARPALTQTRAGHTTEAHRVPPPGEVRRFLVVVAHPDDESFGLGAVLNAYATAGAESAVLCFTHGEASTLHSDDPAETAPGTGAGAGALGDIRAAELAAAGTVLGIGRTELMDYPDGALSRTDVNELAEHVRRIALETAATHLLVFDREGVTGHPDHAHATRAALVAANGLDLPVLAWTLPYEIADALNTAFGTRFTGRTDREPTLRLSVDRARQRRAIECHRSQSTQNPVLYRRLELLGGDEYVRMLRGG